jgi:hypothetical protein
MKEPTIQTQKIKLSFFMVLIFILTYFVLFIGINMIYNGNSGLIFFGIPLLGAIIASFLVKLSSKVKLKNDAQNITFKKNPMISIILWVIFAALLGFLLFWTIPMAFLTFGLLSA